MRDWGDTLLLCGGFLMLLGLSLGASITTLALIYAMITQHFMWFLAVLIGGGFTVMSWHWTVSVFLDMLDA